MLNAKIISLFTTAALVVCGGSSIISATATDIDADDIEAVYAEIEAVNEAAGWEMMVFTGEDDDTAFLASFEAATPDIENYIPGEAIFICEIDPTGSNDDSMTANGVGTAAFEEVEGAIPDFEYALSGEFVVIGNVEIDTALNGETTSTK